MIQDILFAIWFLLPAALANAAPIVAAAIPWLKSFDAPIDNGRTFRGKAIFGPHKTWRGLISGMVVATCILWVQQQCVAHTTWGSSIAGGVDYQALPVLILGPLFAIGALGGDVIESFLKRQRGIASGRSWVPFDQLDYIIGAIIISLLFVRLSLMSYVWMIVLWFLAHLLASYVGWRIGLKKAPI